MKKMKTRTKLAGAVTALVVAVALSAGTTFAWFTANRTVSVTTISANVTSNSGGLEIAYGLNITDDSKFANTIGKDVMDKVTADTVLDAVTTKIDGNKISMIDRTSTNPDNTNVSAAATSYITFDLTLRAKSVLAVNLGAGSNVSSTAAASPYIVSSWKDISANEYGTHDNIATSGSIAAEAANASRVSFEISGFDTSTSAPTSYSSSTRVSSNKVWSPHEADITGKYVDGTSSNITTDNSNKAGFWQGNLASDYEQYLLASSLMTYAELDTATGYTSHWGALDSSYPYTGAAYTQDTTGYTNPLVPLASSSATTYKTNNMIVTLDDLTDGYYYANVTVKIWLEGTDGDCLNSIFSQALNVNLEFYGIASA